MKQRSFLAIPDGPRTKTLLAVALVVSVISTTTLVGFSEGAIVKNNNVDEAIWRYEHEDYEEALELLTELQAKDPRSSLIAYYLGLTYKQLQDLPAARPYLEAAVTLRPKIKNAIPALIDVLYQSDDTEEAMKWIVVAEKESITPAQTAFFKGLVLLKEGDDVDGAIEAFDSAAQLDSSLAETASYYQGLAQLQANRFDLARNTFQDVVSRDPTSDIADFADEYVDLITRKEDAAKPIRGSVGYSFNFDDNVINRPNDQTLSTGIGRYRDWRQVATFQMDYNYKPTDNFGIKAKYSFYGAKQSDLGFYDMMTHDFLLQPTIYTKKASFMFPVRYNNMALNDKLYLETVSLGNVNNIIIDRSQMAQFSFYHNFKMYNWGTTRDNEDRNGNEWLWSTAYYYFFTRDKKGFVNLKYTMNYEQTKGINWTYLGNRFSIGSVIPISKKIRLNLIGDYYAKNFVKTNTMYEKARFDDVLTVSNLLAIDLRKDTELQLQHTFVNNASTIGIYKYMRNVYSAGVKYKF
ncbi:tetratricopeptide repeat protein [Candidatus Omnitrophota bacterium]